MRNFIETNFKESIMKIEAGKTYLTRCGDTEKVRPRSGAVEYPWVSALGLKERTWTARGRYLNDLDDSAHDIVSEVVPAIEAPNRTPHKHAKEMHAFADGYEIQQLVPTSDPETKWEACPNPIWHPLHVFRVKPAPVPNVVMYSSIVKAVARNDTFKLYAWDSKNDAVESAGDSNGHVLRLEINHTDPANPVLVSATLEKP